MLHLLFPVLLGAQTPHAVVDSNPDMAAMFAMLLKGSPALDSLKTTPMALRFTALDGRTVDLAALRGKLVLVDFSAYTWCEGCREIEPKLIEMYKRYHDQGLEIVGFSLENSPDDSTAVRKYVQAHHIPWPLYFDARGVEGNPEVLRYGIRALPYVLFLDRTGRLIRHAIGSSAVDELEPLIQKQLGMTEHTVSS